MTQQVYINTEAQRQEARRLLRLVEQARILNTYVSRQRRYDLTAITQARALRRDRAFWSYVQENLTTLAGL